MQYRRIKITKIAGSPFDMGKERIGLEIVGEPKVGRMYYLEPIKGIESGIKTSVVLEILDENTFRTTNSTYKIEKLENTYKFTREQLAKCGLDKIFILDKSIVSVEISLDLLPQAYYMDYHYKFDIPAIYREIRMPMPEVIDFGSDEYWNMIPKSINAVSLDSRGDLKYWKENYGCYSDYVDNGADHSSKLGNSQHWYYSSIHKETDAPELKKLVNYRDKIKGRGAICEYRPGLPKKVLDLNDIDWNLIPKWANHILVSIRKDGVDIQCVSSGYIDIHGHIHSPYKLPNNTRPSTRIDDVHKYNEYNYNLINIPANSAVYDRPKRKSGWKNLFLKEGK